MACTAKPTISATNSACSTEPAVSAENRVVGMMSMMKFPDPVVPHVKMPAKADRCLT